MWLTQRRQALAVLKSYRWRWNKRLSQDATSPHKVAYESKRLQGRQRSREQRACPPAPAAGHRMNPVQRWRLRQRRDSLLAREQPADEGRGTVRRAALATVPRDSYGQWRRFYTQTCVACAARDSNAGRAPWCGYMSLDALVLWPFASLPSDAVAVLSCFVPICCSCSFMPSKVLPSSTANKCLAHSL